MEVALDIVFKIIKKLLVCNEHAVLPNFGGFVVQTEHATITDNSLLPSRNTISFNPLMKHNDGMFIIELSRVKKISYKEAAAQTAKYIELFRTELKEKGNFTFGDIGEFHQSDKENIEFSPTLLADFIPANFGLQEVVLPHHKDESKELIFSFTARKMMRYAAILITFVALLFSTDLNKSNYISQADFSNLLKFDLPEITVIAVPENSETQEANRQNSVNLPFAYKVIVATFQTEEKAMSYHEELLSEQFTDTEVIVGKTNTKVAIKTFRSIVAAVNYMEQIRHSDNRFSDAWVLKVDTSLN